MTMDATVGRMGRATATRDWDSAQFRAICMLCLPVHLVAAAAARLTPSFWSDRDMVRSGRQSFFAQAWEASSTTARIAFSG